MARVPRRAGAPEISHEKFPIPDVVRWNTLYLTGATALFSMAFITYLSLAPQLVVSLTGSVVFAGAPQSLNTVVRMVSSYPLGRFMDRYGRCLPMAVALLVAGAAAFVVFFAAAARSLGLLFCALAVLSLGYGVSNQVRVAATDMFPPDRKGEGVGYLTAGNVVGSLVGPLLMALAYALCRAVGLEPEVGSWLLLPFFMGAGAWLILSARPDPQEIGKNLPAFYPGLSELAKNSTLPAYPFDRMSLRRMLRYYPILAAVVVSALGWGLMSMMMGLVPVVLGHHGHAARSVAWAIAFHSIGMFGLTIPLGWLADRYGRKAILLWGAVLAGAGALTTGVSASYWGVTLGVVLVGIGWAGTFVGMTALISDVTHPLIRGRALGMADSAGALLSLIFPLLGGVVSEFWGFPFLGLLGLLASLPIVAMALALRESSPGRYRHLVET
jgi:MFS family permease